jgi:hypothetical protein
MPLFQSIAPAGPRLWRTTTGDTFSNPNGGVWGGYAIGLCLRVLEVVPDVRGEPLSLTVTFAAPLPAGGVTLRTRRIRQGGSVGIWSVELLREGSDQVSIQAVITLAQRPETKAFSFVRMPDAPAPESLGDGVTPGGGVRRHGAAVFERRMVGTFPPATGSDSRSLAWIRSLAGPLDKVLLGMAADYSPPRAMYALGAAISTNTLSLTAYLHASPAVLAGVCEDFFLVECEGRIGGGGASDERSSYWSRDGQLLATAEQLVWYRALERPIHGWPAARGHA